MTRILGLLLIGASISIGCSANPTAPSTAMGACGDNPAAASAEYPQTFLGTWTRNDAEVGIVDMVFEAHGTHRLKSRRSQYVGNWWLNGDHLITAYPSTFTYAIADHELRFTATSEPNFYLRIFSTAPKKTRRRSPELPGKKPMEPRSSLPKMAATSGTIQTTLLRKAPGGSQRGCSRFAPSPGRNT